MTGALLVISGAAPATVQDAGRRGHERFGVPRSGAMDQFALAAANLLLGNEPGAAAIEITAGGAVFEALMPLTIAIAGGDLRPLVDGYAAPQWASLLLAAGAELRFAGRAGAHAARAYVAVAGGLAVPALLGSRSTYLPGGWGGLDGRPLRAGDELGLAETVRDMHSLTGRVWAARRPEYAPEPVLRLVPGPHDALLGGLDWLFTGPLIVEADSNRIGYRLDGPARPHTLTLPSFGVLPGALQVPPNGKPILLMADAQPTGGYPVAGVVAAADLGLAAQLLPGDSLRFAPATVAQAQAALLEQRRWLATGVEDDPLRSLLAWAGA